MPSDKRNFSAFEIESMIKKRINNIANIDSLTFQSSPIGDQPDITIELAHYDEEKLKLSSEELKNEIAKISGTQEVDDSYEEGKEEYIFKINEKGYAAGLTPEIIGSQLRSSFFGLEAQRVQRGKFEVIVYVRYPKNQRESLDSLYSTRIRLDDGTQIALRDVVNIEKRQGYSKIETVDGHQIISVTSDVDPTITTPNEVLEVIESDIFPELKKRFPKLKYSLEGESRDQREDLASLGRNMIIALLIIYILLGSQLRSYVQPFIIMLAIPFGIIGAILGHFILGHDLTFISMFGIVALTGVVVNDSVVLLDYLNLQYRSGKTIHQSVIEAVARRFRPILLTTLSTSLGLAPILFEQSLQAKFLIPMVVSLATGIIFATPIILVLVPCLIIIVDDVKKLALLIKNI